MRDMRPPLATPFAAFGGMTLALVSPIGGAPLTAAVVRMGPAVVTPDIGGDPAVMDRPRFRFRRSEVAALPAGSTFTIADGPDVGVWTVDRFSTIDNDVLEVVAE